jgi:anti-sigma regulatory factor (Ser/Thr protein kinase)
MLLNAIEHGGHFDPSQYVEVAYVRTRKLVLCRIKDPGQGFSLGACLKIDFLKTDPSREAPI